MASIFFRRTSGAVLDASQGIYQWEHEQGLPSFVLFQYLFIRNIFKILVFKYEEFLSSGDDELQFVHNIF